MELKTINPNSCILYPPLYQPENMSDKEFLELVNMRNNSIPACLDSLFMAEILLRQSYEDPFFLPFYTFLKYMYLYLWTIVVVRSALILF